MEEMVEETKMVEWKMTVTILTSEHETLWMITDSNVWKLQIEKE